MCEVTIIVNAETLDAKRENYLVTKDIHYRDGFRAESRSELRAENRPTWAAA